jgi:hypothetical protein
MSIVIGPEYDTLLREQAFEGYIGELVDYGEETQTSFLKKLGEAQLRKTLKTVCDKAGTSFGFDERGSTRLYLDLVWAYGWNFETDPQYSWVMQTKEKNNALSQLEQAEILFEEMEDYKQAVWGDGFLHRQACIQNFQTSRIQITAHVRGINFVSDLLYILYNLYQQKYERSNEQALEQLIVEGRARATEVFGFHEPHHQGLVVVLSFLLGHEFYRNPFYNWPKPGDPRHGFDADRTAMKLEAFAQNCMDEGFEEETVVAKGA